MTNATTTDYFILGGPDRGRLIDSLVAGKEMNEPVSFWIGKEQDSLTKTRIFLTIRGLKTLGKHGRMFKVHGFFEDILGEKRPFTMDYSLEEWAYKKGKISITGDAPVISF